MAIQLRFDQEARENVKNGVEKAGRVLKTTIGPLGRTVVLDRGWGSPKILDDGDSVADDIELIDQFENIGAQMVREASKKTSKEAGDGTTTSAILTEGIFLEGIRHITAGVDPMALRRGLNHAAKLLSDAIEELSREVDEDEIERLATVAAKNDETIGGLIAEAYDEVGMDGAISVEEGNQLDSDLWVVKGMQFDRGYLSPEFATDEASGECQLNNPLILVYEDKISSAQDIVPLLEKVSKQERSFLVIAEDVEEEALATMTVNKKRGTVKCAAIKAPGYGERRKEMLRDIATMTNAEPIFEDLGVELDSVSINQLGEAKKVKIDSDRTTISGGAGSQEEIDARVSQINSEIEETDSSYDREKLEERRARLAAGLAEIRIGAATEPDLKEKKSRAKDALSAVEAALEEGVVPGGGVALLRAAETLKKNKGFRGDETVAVEILKTALARPLRKIADNADFDPDLVERRVRQSDEKNFGLDVVTGEYGDMDEFSVLDSTKVVRSAIENACSVAALLLTTECTISELTEEDDDEEEEELSDKERAREAGYVE